MREALPKKTDAEENGAAYAAIFRPISRRASHRPTLTFLNFDKRYPSNLFTAVIRSRYTNEFENLSALRGKAVSVKGEIRDYQGRPEMELTRKSQLKILGDTK